MAHIERLGPWALTQAKALNLKVTKLEWVHDYFPGYTDLQIKIEIDSRIFEGRGSDLNKDIAFAKGLTEAIERYVCFSNGLTSLGVAGHYDFEKAKENAYLEFVERSLLNFHFQKKVTMKKISSKPLHIKVIGHDNVFIFNIHHFQMNIYDGLFGVFTLAEGLSCNPQFGGIMGASVSTDLDSAITKSSIECMRNVAALAEHRLKPLGFQDFKVIKHPTSEDSRRLLFSPEYSQGLLNIFDRNSNSEIQNPDFKFNGMFFKELSYSHSLLKDCPLRFALCLDSNGASAPDTEFVG